VRTIGRLTTALMVMALAAGVAVGIRNIDDIQRYLKMRQM
jgi:hypothetical protein